MTAPPSVSIGDLERAYYLAAVPAADNNLAVSMGQGVATISKQASLQSQTRVNSANAVAPGASVAIVSLTIPTTGYYQCDVTVGFGSTAESTAIDNFIFQNNGSAVGNGILACPNAINAQAKYTIFVQGVATQQLWVVTNSAGSAGSVYKATIAATRIA